MLFCFLYPQIPLFEDPNTLASQPNITMDFLHEASIIGFTGTDQEMHLVSFLFGCSTSITCMTILPECDDNDDPNRSQLLEIPFTGHGCWHFQRDKYTWKRTQYEGAQGKSCAYWDLTIPVPPTERTGRHEGSFVLRWCIKHLGEIQMLSMKTYELPYHKEIDV